MGNGKHGKSWIFFFIQAWKVMEFLKVWVIMDNKVICKLRKQKKAAHNQETFPRQMAKFRL